MTETATVTPPKKPVRVATSAEAKLLAKDAKSYVCKVCRNAYTATQAFVQNGECECGQGLSDEAGIGLLHYYPEPKKEPVKVATMPTPNPQNAPVPSTPPNQPPAQPATQANANAANPVPPKTA